ncbi:hypothetical protein RAMDARK_1034 [Rickettsia amblyommatis str. Darkwater]|nr:hypothetical protein RAMDARK_1034 [Rickettsia amblyommatis str. Darkwater]
MSITSSKLLTLSFLLNCFLTLLLSTSSSLSLSVNSSFSLALCLRLFVFMLELLRGDSFIGR